MENQNSELKTLNEVIKENLRILSEKNNSAKKSISNLASKNIIPISEEELDVEQLEFKSINYGNKFFKNIRKLLHREIRDWLIFPFQKKQTIFNRKISENFSNLSSMIESLHDEQTSLHDEQTSLHDEQTSLHDELTSLDFMETQKVIKSQIEESFLKILERKPDDRGIQYYTKQLFSGTLTLKELEENLMNSEEYIILQKKQKFL